jgi:hypothetical protein
MGVALRQPRSNASGCQPVVRPQSLVSLTLFFRSSPANQLILKKQAWHLDYRGQLGDGATLCRNIKHADAGATALDRTLIANSVTASGENTFG